MSFLSVEWAINDAPVASLVERAVLIALAQRSGDDGCNAYRSKKTIGQIALIDPKTAQRVIADLQGRGVLALGDQAAAAHIDPRYRPRVYDLQIPYSWYGSKIHRVNDERASKGRPPLAPEDRPDLAPAPARPSRSDKGKKAPQRRPKSLGPREEETPDQDAPEPGGDSQSPLTEAGQNPSGDSQSPLDEQPRGDSQSHPGGIENPSRGDSQSPNYVGELRGFNYEEPALPAVGDYSTVGSSALAAVPAGKPRPLAAVPDPEPTPAEPPPVHASASTIGDVYRAFTAVMPPDLMPRISKRSGDIAGIIRAELAHRSPAELVERIGRRWETWRYRVEDIRDPVAVAQTLLRQHLPGRTCPDLRCEDGHQLDLDQPCTACTQVADEVAAQRAKAARPATSAPEPTPADAPPALLAPSVPFPPSARERAIEARPDTPPGFTREDAAPAYARGLAEVRATLASQKAQRGRRGGQPTAQTIKSEGGVDTTPPSPGNDPPARPSTADTQE